MNTQNSAAEHWEAVYGAKASEDMSWFQPVPLADLADILALGLPPDAPIIDIGGGHSLLIDHLLAAGCTDLTVLDISTEALARAQQRLGPVAPAIHWVAADIRHWAPTRPYTLWHDRALLHFLTNAVDVAHYVGLVTQWVTQYVRISAFAAPDGPLKCSGLEVHRYTEDDFATLLAPAFTLLEVERHTHTTPWGAQQAFITGVWRRAQVAV